MNSSSWQFSKFHNSPCKVIEEQTLWEQSFCRVWLPNDDAVVRVLRSQLEPLGTELHPECVASRIAYVAAAARVADALTQDVLLAPIESSVIPLPHQIKALSRAISGDRVRYLLADEVGLGKTIEAGLILRELKLRGLVKRVLVIAPKGLLTQWVAEMRTHFNEDFRLLIPSDFSAYRRIAKEDNIWQSHPQVVCPMDSVKPLESRRDWPAKQVADYNQERFEDLVSAGWDLVIVDEAHRLGGSTDQVARFKLGQGLCEAAPYFLMLSATPHQGKTDAFHRLVSLLDAQDFPDVGSVTRDRVQPYVIRTEKRHAITAEGNPLFKPRKTELAPVSWGETHRDQQLLYEAVTEYVREGYNQAMREKRSYIGFLMILMQRLVVSSTTAIRTTLERRLEALDAPQEQLSLFPMYSDDEWADLDGQEQIETLLTTRLKALKNERSEVKLLLETATRCMQAGADAKAEALLDWLYKLQAEEGDPELKALVFTEFVPTQQMLQQFLTERGFQVVCLNGSMDMDERKKVQEAFAEDARILISTDAGGEGLNLQFCHVVINYDIPWNPMRLEQRIGRVDRIGQTHVVRAVNFVFEDSVEHRVREVLEEKLAVIFEDFGIDKTGDVLDSAQAGQVFDDLYVDAILNPDEVDATVDKVVTRLQEQIRDTQESSSILGATEGLEPSEAQRLMAHPLPHWVERMTVSYLRAHGGKAERNRRTWNLTWPDGEELTRIVFSGKEAEQAPTARHLTLEDSRIRGLAMRLPRFAPGQPVSVVTIPGITDEVTGLWSLWRIGIATMDWNRHRIMPLFLADGGKVFTPTARHLWDRLLSVALAVRGHLEIDDAQNAFDRLSQIAEEHGRSIYDELVQEHRSRLTREREKGEYAFTARRKIIERIGLPQVRDYRLNLLRQEERSWNEELERKAQVYPEMAPLLVIRVEPEKCEVRGA
ncbi:MAG: helicase-related protein [Thermodesulfobacteriota bacterium]|nr:helicase-related protein [Thermodesulfobacteriota bacterium]